MLIFSESSNSRQFGQLSREWDAYKVAEEFCEGCFPFVKFNLQFV